MNRHRTRHGRRRRLRVPNVRVLCASHNLEAARRALGDELMDRYAGKKARRRRAASERRDLVVLPGLDPPRVTSS